MLDAPAPRLGRDALPLARLQRAISAQDAELLPAARDVAGPLADLDVQATLAGLAVQNLARFADVAWRETYQPLPPRPVDCIPPGPPFANWLVDLNGNRQMMRHNFRMS